MRSAPFSSSGAEYSEIRVLDVGQRKLLPESIYPSYGPFGWTMDSGSLFYDAGKVSYIKSAEIELHRKTGAMIEESYPDYVIGYVGTVQSELRAFYALAAPMKNGGNLDWRVLCKQNAIASALTS